MTNNYLQRWSPKPPEAYGWPADLDIKLWNLAWLTLPHEGIHPPREDIFGALAASLDCLGELNGTTTFLHQRLEMPANHFVTIVKAIKWQTLPPIFALDSNWRKNWTKRAAQARANHPFDLKLCIDTQIVSTASARKLIMEKGWASSFQDVDS